HWSRTGIGSVSLSSSSAPVHSSPPHAARWSCWPYRRPPVSINLGRTVMTEEKATVPIYEIHFGYTDEESPNPFVAIGPLADDSYAGYLVDKKQLQEAWQRFAI